MQKNGHDDKAQGCGACRRTEQGRLILSEIPQFHPNKQPLATAEFEAARQRSLRYSYRGF